MNMMDNVRKRGAVTKAKLYRSTVGNRTPDSSFIQFFM
jgi:hypothetical protein